MDFTILTWLAAFPLFAFVASFQLITPSRLAGFLPKQVLDLLSRGVIGCAVEKYYIVVDSIQTRVPSLQNYCLALQCAAFITAFPGLAQWLMGLVLPVGLRLPDRKPYSSTHCLLEESFIQGESRFRLIFRVVTRGTNPDLVATTVKDNLQTIERSLAKTDGERPFFNFLVEVVTDNAIGIRSHLSDAEAHAVSEIVVPTDFQTPRGTLFKARALHYANVSGESSARPSDIIVHLDEESRLEVGSVRGIQRFAANHPDGVGQGAIFYGRREVTSPWWTLCDSIRCADDYLRFRTFFALGKPLQGMKGSFFVLSSATEKRIGFDLGPEGSITEDAVFAFKAMEANVRFHFIEGHVTEQSPFSLSDFCKQRARWLKGLHNLIHMSEFRLRTRLALGISVYAWIVCPFTCLVTVIMSWLSLTPRLPVVFWMHAILLTTVRFIYIFGAIHNFSFKSVGWKYPFYLIASSLLCPAFWLCEASAVGYFLTNFWHGGFHIVQKQRLPAPEMPNLSKPGSGGNLGILDSHRSTNSGSDRSDLSVEVAAVEAVAEVA